jgi:hypothetical protein
MLIFKILIIISAIFLLFLLFLPSKLEFIFAKTFWKLRIKNLFFEKNFGSKEETPMYTEEPQEVFKAETAKSLGDEKTEESKEESFTATPSYKNTQKEECRERKSKEKTKKIKKENKKTPSQNLVKTIKEIWGNEQKLIKSLVKFLAKTVKLTLKLLKPAKIEINASGGFTEAAETGWFYSVFIIFQSFFEKNKEVSLNFTPQFYDVEWDFNGKISYKVSIAKLLFFLLAILVYVPYFRIVKYFWKRMPFCRRTKPPLDLD